MDLDAAEEKMLRAIVQTAAAEAAAGRSFAGDFRHYRISATRLDVNEDGVAQVGARIVQRFGTAAQTCCDLVLADRVGEADRREEFAVVAIGVSRRDGVHIGVHCASVPSFSAPQWQLQVIPWKPIGARD